MSLASFEAPLDDDEEEELASGSPAKTTTLKPLYEAALPNKPLQDIKSLLAAVLRYDPNKSFRQLLGSSQLASLADKLVLKEAFEQLKKEEASQQHKRRRPPLSQREDDSFSPKRSHHRQQVVYVSTQWQCVTCGRLFHGDRRASIAFCPACGVPPTLKHAQQALCFAIEAYRGDKKTAAPPPEPLSNSGTPNASSSADDPPSPLLSSPEHAALEPDVSLLSGGLIDEIQYYLAH